MFILAIIIGFYSYVIFFLGVTGLLYLKFVLPLTILFILLSVFFVRRLIQFINALSRLTIFPKFLLILLFVQIMVNLIGALGPELSFDALWYHLTLPKLYVQNHTVSFFSGGLLYYSAMPKLTEMLYTVVLLFSNEITAKLVHFSFGILVLITIYKITRKYFDKTFSLLACLIFYANLVVGWMSITAYVDLARTFYELMTFWAFILFTQKRERKYLVLSAVFMGFSISTKLISVGSVLIYIFLFLFSFGIRKNIKNTVIHIVSFILIALFISLPWLIFSYLNTGNPIYPIFSGYSLSPVTHLFSPINFLKESWILFTRAGDPLSPIYIIILPVIIVLVKRLKKNEKLFALYSFLGLIVWYITPRTGGGRFILPYLPVASIFMVMLVSKFPSWLKKYSITLIILISLISIGYRAFANKRYLPVILGKQTKGDFLIKNLNFKFGDFYDIDGYFAKTIKPTDRVLIYGIHNLYYADFPFIHESYLKKGDRFNYILLGNAPELGGLPRKYSNWRLIYQNDKLGIKFYAD